jgi:glutamate racemase
MRAYEKACPLLVPLVEEGWIDHPITEEVLGIYIDELLQESRQAGLNPDTLVLGCTHYPLLRANIERKLPSGIRVIDSAQATAAQVASALATATPRAGQPPQRRFYATDSVNKFRSLGTRFLGEPIEQVELIDLGG